MFPIRKLSLFNLVENNFSYYYIFLITILFFLLYFSYCNIIDWNKFKNVQKVYNSKNSNRYKYFYVVKGRYLLITFSKTSIGGRREEPVMLLWREYPYGRNVTAFKQRKSREPLTGDPSRIPLKTSRKLPLTFLTIRARKRKSLAGKWMPRLASLKHLYKKDTKHCFKIIYAR